MSAPFQSSLNQGFFFLFTHIIVYSNYVFLFIVHSIYLINQNDLNETRPSSLIRSVVEPNVLQSLLTTNPVLLAVDDLIREQSSLLRSFIHLQRTYYESTVRSIRPEHVYVTKDNTLQVNYYFYPIKKRSFFLLFLSSSLINNNLECIYNQMMIQLRINSLFFSLSFCILFYIL